MFPVLAITGIGGYLARFRAKRDFTRMLEDARSKTEKEFKPIRDLSLEIVNASMNCLNQMKEQGLIRPQEGDEQVWQEMLAFCEFLYFFLHMTNRTAFPVLSETEMKHLQNHLGRLMAGTVVDSWCGHWPEDRKMAVVDDFFSNLNDAEIEYVKCSGLDSRLPPEEASKLIWQRLFMRLGQQVAAVVREEGNPGTTLAVLHIANTEFVKINLMKHVEGFKRDSISAPLPPFRI